MAGAFNMYLFIYISVKFVVISMYLTSLFFYRLFPNLWTSLQFKEKRDGTYYTNVREINSDVRLIFANATTTKPSSRDTFVQTLCYLS